MREAIENLKQALRDAGGRRKAFKAQPVKLDARQKEVLIDFKKHYNKGLLIDIEAYNILRGWDNVVAVQVIWRLTPKTGETHYFTQEAFLSLIKN